MTVQLRNVSLQWRTNWHYCISNHQPYNCLLNCLFCHRSMKTSKLHIIGLCVGNLPVTAEFPAQMASNAENVSIWLPHQVLIFCFCNYLSVWIIFPSILLIKYSQTVFKGLIMDMCGLLTLTPECVVSQCRAITRAQPEWLPHGETTHEGVDVNNTHLSMINPDYNMMPAISKLIYPYPNHKKQIKAWIESNRSLCCHVTT